jgi:hypothetical protein
MPLRTAGRFNADLAHDAILVQHDGVRYFAERDLADACDRATTIRDIATGQVEGVVRVYAFNPVEHTADDVTEEIAIAIANAAGSEPITAGLRDFIEEHAGLDYARGLAVADRAFAA